MTVESKKEAVFKIHYGYFPAPKVLQIEITNACPLSCVQCYKMDNFLPSYMKFETFRNIVDEAAKMGVHLVTLNGGEPLCHPDFLKMVRYAASKQLMVVTYVSGFGLNQDCVDQLSGINNLQLMISLNGSLEEINGLSRDGYDHAIKALECLSKSEVHFVYAINWVARNDNVDDLPNLLKLSLRYGAKFINIVGNKVTHDGKIESPLTKNNYLTLTKIIKENGEHFTIQVCYGILWAQIVPDDQISQGGCPAGIRMCGVNVEGKYIPCTHLNYAESHESIKEYWNNSLVLGSLRAASKRINGGKCESCIKYKNCKFCHAISAETYYDLSRGVSNCVLYEKRKDDKSQEEVESDLRLR